MLAQALRHETPPELDFADLPGTVPQPPKRPKSATTNQQPQDLPTVSRQQSYNGTKNVIQPLPTIESPMTSRPVTEVSRINEMATPPPPLPPRPVPLRAPQYSPEELQLRLRGILGLALTRPITPPNRNRNYVIDSDEEEFRGGIIGKSLGRSLKRTLSSEGTRKRQKVFQRRRSQGDAEDSFDYGGGILGKALQRFSTRESLATLTKETTPAVSRKTSHVPPPRSDAEDSFDYGGGILGKALQRFSTRESLATITKETTPTVSRKTSHVPPPRSSLVSGDGRGGEESLPVLKKEESKSSEGEIEDEMEELYNLETLSKIDPSSKILFLVKKNKWDDVEKELTKIGQKFDFTIADKNGFTPLLLAVKQSKIQIVDKMIKMGADLYATTKVSRG
uniref:Uncharacterized protein n=1 Tax=Panagrolaimus sp. JU765 TaxID=591449 RepID=A0AC34R0L3_9BILA